MANQVRHDDSNKKSRRVAGFFRYADRLSAHPNFHHAAALLNQVNTRPMELSEESVFERSSGTHTDKPQVTALDIEHLHIPVRERHTNISNGICSLVHNRIHLNHRTIDKLYRAIVTHYRRV